MSFPTWTESLKIPVDEDIVWHHRPDPTDPKSTDPSLWQWRRDRRITFSADIEMAARFESDFIDYRNSETIVDPVFRYWHAARRSHVNVRYNGTWIIDNISVSHLKQGGKTVISVTLVNISDEEYNWATRASE